MIGSGHCLHWPGELIDGPFTSSDLNTLLKATTGGKLGIALEQETLTGQTSRIDVAAACVECLSYSTTQGKVFELINKGARPAEIDWAALFTQLPTHWVIRVVNFHNTIARNKLLTNSHLLKAQRSWVNRSLNSSLLDQGEKSILMRLYNSGITLVKSRHE